MGGLFTDPLSITTRQGWPALSSYLKIGRGGDVGGSGGQGISCLFFPLSLNLRNLPPAFSLQPSKKIVKVKRKDSLMTVVKYFLFENFAKAGKGHKIIIGAKIFGVLLAAHSFLRLGGQPGACIHLVLPPTIPRPHHISYLLLHAF